MMLDFDSFVKDINKLIQNNGPVANRHGPFFCDLENSQVNRFFQCIIGIACPFFINGKNKGGAGKWEKKTLIISLLITLDNTMIIF